MYMQKIVHDDVHAPEHPADAACDVRDVRYTNCTHAYDACYVRYDATYIHVHVYNMYVHSMHMYIYIYIYSSSSSTHIVAAFFNLLYATAMHACYVRVHINYCIV